MIVAGIGARGGATAQEIAEAVRDACGRAGLEVSEVGIVCGMQRAAVTEAASELSVQAKLCTLDELRAEAERCVTHSERSMAATGVPSVAEAAAMAAAGPDGMMFLPRVAYANVTVALAIAPGATEP